MALTTDPLEEIVSRGYARRAWVVGIACAMAAGACFVDNPGAPPAGTTSSAGAGGAGAPDAATVTSSSGGGGGGAPPSMCERYGGYASVESVVTDMVARLGGDCRIQAFFAGLGADQRLHLADCLTKQLAVMTHCPGILYDVDSSGQGCRDMKTAHHGLGIRQGDYDAFVEDLQESFASAGFSSDDIKALTPPLQFFHGDVVTNSAPGLDHDACDAGDGG